MPLRSADRPAPAFGMAPALQRHHFVLAQRPGTRHTLNSAAPHGQHFGGRAGHPFAIRPHLICCVIDLDIGRGIVVDHALPWRSFHAFSPPDTASSRCRLFGRPPGSQPWMKTLPTMRSAICRRPRNIAGSCTGCASDRRIGIARGLPRRAALDDAIRLKAEERRLPQHRSRVFLSLHRTDPFSRRHA